MMEPPCKESKRKLKCNNREISIFFWKKTLWENFSTKKERKERGEKEERTIRFVRMQFAVGRLLRIEQQTTTPQKKEEYENNHTINTKHNKSVVTQAVHYRGTVRCSGTDCSRLLILLLLLLLLFGLLPTLLLLLPATFRLSNNFALLE
jgi:hypothetical protein